MSRRSSCLSSSISERYRAMIISAARASVGGKGGSSLVIVPWSKSRTRRVVTPSAGDTVELDRSTTSRRLGPCHAEERPSVVTRRVVRSASGPATSAARGSARASADGTPAAVDFGDCRSAASSRCCTRNFSSHSKHCKQRPLSIASLCTGERRATTGNRSESKNSFTSCRNKEKLILCRGTRPAATHRLGIVVRPRRVVDHGPRQESQHMCSSHGRT